MFNRNEDRWYLLGGTGGQCIRPTTLPPSCTDCLEIPWPSKSWSLMGPSRPGTGWLPSYTLSLYFHLCQHQPNYFFPLGFPMTIIYSFLQVLDPFYLYPYAIFGENTKFHILIIQLSQASFSSVTLISGPPAERQTSFTSMQSSGWDSYLILTIFDWTCKGKRFYTKDHTTRT
jgi:hypothetical protein